MVCGIYINIPLILSLYPIKSPSNRHELPSDAKSQAVMAVRDGGRACYVGIASATTRAEVPTLGRRIRRNRKLSIVGCLLFIHIHIYIYMYMYICIYLYIHIHIWFIFILLMDECISESEDSHNPMMRVWFFNPQTSSCHNGIGSLGYIYRYIYIYT